MTDPLDYLLKEVGQWLKPLLDPFEAQLGDTSGGRLTIVIRSTHLYTHSNLFWIHPWAFLLMAVCVVSTGCAGGKGPEMITIQAQEYPAAFDVAVQVARENGMRPAFLDRRAGIIETEPVIAGSILEPWYSNNADFNQTIRNTLARNRFRARFEFTRSEFTPRTQSEDIPPVDLLGTTNQQWDLTTDTVPLDLRVWVFEERGHTVGQRRNTWTFIGNSNTYHVPVNGAWDENAGTFWTPTTRDEPAERRLLAEVEQRLKSGNALATVPDDSSDPTP